jgi:cell fate regulator YaaT (PSP1 superfamily)
MSCTGCSLNSSANYLAINSYSWLDELPDTSDQSDIVEVKFKSTRKEYYKNSDKIDLKRGDKVVVATAPGHDLGEVTLTGYLAEKQFKLKIRNTESYKLNSVYRKSTAADVALLDDARNREKPVMIRARQIVLELGLDMKIGDVEFRGDGKKAIFYYLADGRVDFRELIKVYAREFGILIEMKQIGARQEAGIVGGIGSCGRELCCSSWRTNFKSISSNAALTQGLSPSALKMAGACGKLKCCLMYELDTYIEAQKDFPRELLNLELAKGIAKPFKTDYLKKEICYVMQGGGGMFNLSLQEVKDIIQKNKRGIRPEIGSAGEKAKEENQMEVKLDERIDRFDKNKRTINKKRR